MAISRSPRGRDGFRCSPVEPAPGAPPPRPPESMPITLNKPEWIRNRSVGEGMLSDILAHTRSHSEIPTLLPAAEDGVAPHVAPYSRLLFFWFFFPAFKNSRHPGNRHLRRDAAFTKKKGIASSSSAEELAAAVGFGRTPPPPPGVGPHRGGRQSRPRERVRMNVVRRRGSWSPLRNPLHFPGSDASQRVNISAA